MNPLLTAEAIRVTFFARKGLLGSVPVPALDGVSLEVGEGETVAVVGESGSGKTTLARVCLRLLSPTSGQVRFGGVDITRLGQAEMGWFRRRAQGIFQDPFSSLDPYMTVFEAVAEPLIVHGEGGVKHRSELVYQALEEVGLAPTAELSRKYPHQLSGGQRQRAAAARALILGPELIIADEPVSLLDASSRAELLYLFRKLQRQRGLAFLYITHDLSTARHFSDRIAVMRQGRVVETGPTAEVIAHPSHPYTRALLHAVPQPDPANRFRERRVSF